MVEAPALPLTARHLRGIGALAAAVAALVAVSLTALHFWSARARVEAEARGEARVVAATVSALAGNNPDLWHFEEQRVLAQLELVGRGHRRVLNAEGGEVAGIGAAPAPKVEVVEPVIHDGRAVGQVEVALPLDAALRETGRVAAGALLLGVLLFWLFRQLPLRFLRQALGRASFLATHDTLTGLPNRTLFHDRLEQALAGRRDGSVVAIFLDLDGFKEVNDALGHEAGDEVLREAARRLRSELRAEDTLARLGADEFAVIGHGAEGPEAAEALAARLLRAVSVPFAAGGQETRLGATAGIALRPAGVPAAEATAMLREADLALHSGKRQARGGFRFFASGMNQALRERRALLTDLEAALAAGEFALHFQPQVLLDGRALVGAEALIRWNHKLRGIVSPADFIPLAEETGLILPIGEWVLRAACREAAAWPRPVRVAVNVSAPQFRERGFVERVALALSASGLDPARLELEVTEGLLLRDTEDVLHTLRALEALGVSLAMDDFGTGYSSLGYLRKFRFDKLKIDRSFVRGLGEEADAEPIARAIIGMAEALGMRVIAEGVETEAQSRLLRAAGCAEAQGFLFGRPVPAADFRRLQAGWATMPVRAAG